MAEADALSEIEWVERVGKILDWRGTTLGIPEDDLPDVLKPEFDVRQDLVISSEGIRRELGFSEQHSREDALQKTVEWQSLNLGQAAAMSAVYRAEDRVLERRG